jgi:glycogen synthase
VHEEPRLAGMPDAIRVLVVASWYPTVGDPAFGAFVADQVDALAATGRVRPVVVSFELARISGSKPSKRRQVTAVNSAVERSIRDAEILFAASPFGRSPDVPIARLTIADGVERDSGWAHAAVHRDGALRALAERARRDGIEAAIVHGHTVYPDGAVAATAARRLGRPLVVTEHASFVDRILDSPTQQARYLDATAAAARVIAVSEVLAAELRAAVPGLEEKLVVIPNAVDVETFRLAPTEDRDPNELLFVGYRKPSKGIAVLLRAFALVAEQRPALTLRLIGRSETPAVEADWHRLAGELGIADRVTFDGLVGRSEVAAAMARASIFVHPSPRETFGVVAVEALATGTPVVAADSGGVTEVLGGRAAELGAIVERDSPSALATGILATLDRRMTFDPTALRASVVDRFGAAVVAERLADLYASVLAGSPAPAAREPSIRVARTAPPRPVFVAFERVRAAAVVGALPAELRSSLTVVTGTAPADRAASFPGVGRLIEASVVIPKAPPVTASVVARYSPALARIVRLIRHPSEGLSRLRHRGDGARQVEIAALAVDEALRSPADETAVEGHMICLDGWDHVVTEAARADGRARGLPGGISWLADLWWSERHTP